MTTTSIPNTTLSEAMQRGIRGLEKNGFSVRRILPVELTSGIHTREFRADLAKPTKTGLLAFSVHIDTGGNVTNPKP